MLLSENLMRNCVICCPQVFFQISIIEFIKWFGMLPSKKTNHNSELYNFNPILSHGDNILKFPVMMQRWGRKIEKNSQSKIDVKIIFWTGAFWCRQRYRIKTLYVSLWSEKIDCRISGDYIKRQTLSSSSPPLNHHHHL